MRFTLSVGKSLPEIIEMFQCSRYNCKVAFSWYSLRNKLIQCTFSIFFLSPFLSWDLLYHTCMDMPICSSVGASASIHVLLTSCWLEVQGKHSISCDRPQPDPTSTGAWNLGEGEGQRTEGRGGWEEGER